MSWWQGVRAGVHATPARRLALDGTAAGLLLASPVAVGWRPLAVVALILVCQPAAGRYARSSIRLAAELATRQQPLVDDGGPAIPGGATAPGTGQPAVPPARPALTPTRPAPVPVVTAAAGPVPAGDRYATALATLFADHNVRATVAGLTRGPAVLRYELTVAAGEPVAKVSKLQQDIAYTLGTDAVRLLVPIPGKSAIGVEVPRPDRQDVPLGELLASPRARADRHPLLVGLGRDVAGGAILPNIARLPHILLAGATNQGKSISLRAIICSVIARATPAMVRALLIDTKRVEFARFDGIPHLVTPVVTNPLKAADALDWAAKEMELRYEDLAAAGATNLDEYNQIVMTRRVTRDGRVLRPYPYLLIVIDELADLMMVAPRDVEDAIIRIGQLARAAGIHLVLATQRPSVDVVTGLIKANMPCRLAFTTASGADSKVILDRHGAERLTGRGDALFLPPGAGEPIRIQGANITDAEVIAIVERAKAMTADPYHVDINPRAGRNDQCDDTRTPAINVAPLTLARPADGGDLDLLVQSAELVITSQFGSTSMLQRKLRIGFARAGALVDELEEHGIVGPQQGSRARDVLVAASDLEQTLSAIRRRHQGRAA